MFSLQNTILPSLFPYQCVGCKQYDTVLCSVCALDALDSEHLVLPFSSPIYSITTLGEYKHPVWKTAVKQLKFSGIQELAQPLGQLLAGVLCTALYLSDTPYIVPIPLHSKRIRERGYNQTERIATALGNITGWPVLTTIIERTLYAQPQSSLEHSIREQNIAGAYTLCTNAPSIQNQTIILIDDVITTGSTLLEVGRVLQGVKPARIYGAAIARGG